MCEASIYNTNSANHHVTVDTFWLDLKSFQDSTQMSRDSLKEKEQINSAHTRLRCVGNPVLQLGLEGAYKTAEDEGISERLFCPHNQVEEIKCVRNARLIYQGE